MELINSILTIPDPNIPLKLTTDASGTAIGAILSQNNQPIAFMSKRLSEIQKRWSPAELERFAVVSACQKFRHYLTNRPFTIYCDQHGFVQALNSSNKRGVKNAKFARWKIELAEFEFNIEHLPGKFNTAADALSRVSSIQQDHIWNLIKARHEQYGHPGSFRLSQLLKLTDDFSNTSNLQHKCQEIIKDCKICAEIKPKWQKPFHLRFLGKDYLLTL